MTSTAWTRRLPRANTPLPDESLAGYLLNLAQRLDLTPAELIQRTGLKTGRASLLDISWRVTLPDAPAERFSHATGMTTTHAADLTAARWSNTIHLGRIAVTDHGQRWIDPTRSKFCPRCLADPDQPHPLWKNSWQLPWTVACVHHKTLLITNCPACNTPSGEPGGKALRSLIPHIAHPVDHPAACRAVVIPRTNRRITEGDYRSTLCGYRLDKAKAPQAQPALLDLQERLHQALVQPDTTHPSVGTDVSANQWLKDLRLTCVLLQLARSQEPFATNPYGDTAAEYVTSQAPNQPRGARTNNFHTKPPENPAVLAGLLLTADRLTRDQGDPDELATLAKAAREHNRGIVKLTINHAQPSERLRETVTDSKFRLTEPRRIRPYSRRPHTYTADHVPAYLDQDLYLEHFADIGPGGYLERPLRRYIPITLVRLVTDLGPTEAGHLLGYTKSLTEAATARSSDAFDRIGHNELLRRTALIADHINDQPLIDWARRRNYFTPTWTIPEHDWLQLQSTLTEARAARADTPWQQRRPAYAAWVWEHVTHGDIRNAPMIQTIVNGRQCTDGVTKHISDIRRRCPDVVHQVVSDLAQTYADTIDSQA